MNRYIEEEDGETEQATVVAFKSKYNRKPKPTKKESYEGNADVQRWLKEQAVEEGGSKAPFNPTFLASLRDGPWILSSLTQFYEEDLITDVLYAVKSGKEATVYCCVAHPKAGAEFLAAKIYRPRMFRSLKNDVLYRTGRIQRDRDGQVLRSGRGKPGAGGMQTERGRAAQVASWIGFEYETQQELYNAGAGVPKPFAQIGNAVLMEYVGDDEGAAPLLREIRFSREEGQEQFEHVLNSIELFLNCHRIHGDLSEYNMLYWQGKIVLIDFAQAIDPRYSTTAYSFLERDVERVCRYFARCGVQADAQELAHEMWERYGAGEEKGGQLS